MLPTLRVHSFINYLTSDGTNTKNAGPDEARLRFGGTFGPVLDLAIDGTRSAIVCDAANGADGSAA